MQYKTNVYIPDTEDAGRRLESDAVYGLPVGLSLQDCGRLDPAQIQVQDPIADGEVYPGITYTVAGNRLVIQAGSYSEVQADIRAVQHAINTGAISPLWDSGVWQECATSSIVEGPLRRELPPKLSPQAPPQPPSLPPFNEEPLDLGENAVTVVNARLTGSLADIISATVATSLIVSLLVSAVASATSLVVAGTAVSSAGDALIAVLAVQRFVVVSDLNISKSGEHEKIGEQLSWAMGSFGLAPALGVGNPLPPGKSEHTSRPGRQLARARRQLLEDTPPAPPPDISLSLPPALPPTLPLDQCDWGTLNDRLLTLGVILTVALVLQLGAHIWWKRVPNWGYYHGLGAEKLRRVQTGVIATTTDAATTATAALNVRVGPGKTSNCPAPEQQRVPLSLPPSPPDEANAQLNSLRRGASSRALVRARSKGSQSSNVAGLVTSSKALSPSSVVRRGSRCKELARAHASRSNHQAEIVTSAHEAVNLRTELHEAAQASQLHVVALLISQGALLEATDEDGLTPLHEAVRAGHANVVLLLLERGAEVDARDRNGRTPLHMAVEQSFLGVMKMLVKYGAELQAIDHDGRTTVDVATENNHSEIAVWLGEAIAAKGPAKSAKHLKFYPFPSWMRWPTVPLYVCICCLSGLVQSAFAGSSNCGRTFITIVPLAIVIAVLVLMWAQLVVFHCRHRRAMWRSDEQQQQLKPDGDKGLDQAQRLLSTMRRPRGEFVKDTSEMYEPDRTERLLAKPMLFFPRNAADAYESMAVTVLFRCRGDAKHAMAYHMGKLSAQLAMVALASSGAALAEGSSAAFSLAITALVVQISVFMWIAFGQPSIDRVDRLVHAASWGADSAATALLLLHASAESTGGRLATTALLIALLGMALPIVKLVCNIFEPIYRLLLLGATRRAGQNMQLELSKATHQRDEYLAKAEKQRRQAQGGQPKAKDDHGRTEQVVEATAMTFNTTLTSGSASANPNPDIKCVSLLSAAAPASLMRKPSLKSAIRTVQIAQHVEQKLSKRREGLLEGRHALLPAGAPPLGKTTTTALLAPLNATSWGAAAPAPAMPRRRSLKAAARTVQTTIHIERRLTLQRQGLREGRHVPLPPGLPQGLLLKADTSPNQPERGRIALRRDLRRVLQAQSFDSHISTTTPHRTAPRARVSDSAPIAASRVSLFPARFDDHPISFDKLEAAFARVETQARHAARNGPTLFHTQ